MLIDITQQVYQYMEHGAKGWLCVIAVPTVQANMRQ